MSSAPISYINAPLLELPNCEQIEELAQWNFAVADELLFTKMVQQDRGETAVKEAINRQSSIPILEHELSPYYADRNEPKHLLDNRTSLERTIARRLLKRWPSTDFPQSSVAFQLLRSTADQLHAGRWRKGLVQCLPDRMGYAVRFPHPDQIAGRLEQIFECLRSNYERHPVYAATAALSAISSIHPLTDGNGRLSRVIFNTIIAKRFETDFYLPVYELAHVSNGGFIVSIRNSQYYNKWSDLSAFILNSLRIFSAR